MVDCQSITSLVYCIFQDLPLYNNILPLKLRNLIDFCYLSLKQVRESCCQFTFLSVLIDDCEVYGREQYKSKLTVFLHDQKT